MEENNKPLQPQTTPTSQKQEVKAPKISVILMLVFVLGLTAFIVWGIYKAAFPPAPPLQGQIESRTISVASKVPGRIHKVLVSEGDFVKANQPVALMSLPELEAKLQQVQAQERAAQAKQSLVDEGARPQEKQAARAQWERAQAAAALRHITESLHSTKTVWSPSKSMTKSRLSGLPLSSKQMLLNRCTTLPKSVPASRKNPPLLI